MTESGKIYHVPIKDESGKVVGNAIVVNDQIVRQTIIDKEFIEKITKGKIKEYTIVFEENK